MDSAQFTGTFDWIGEPGDPIPEQVALIDRMAAHLAANGLALPPDFINYLAHIRGVRLPLLGREPSLHGAAPRHSNRA